MPTTSLSTEVVKRGPGRPRKYEQTERFTFVSDFARHLLPRIHTGSGITFPSPVYRDDPVRFAREILGVEPWSKQVEILCAIRDHMRVAVKSGHKVGKSSSAGIAALWFYSSYDAARVVATSTTARQVDEILWREVRMLVARAGVCVDCKRVLLADPHARIPRPCPHSSLIDGELGDLARTGLKSNDFREIVGFTAKQSEAVAGISGTNVLYLVDEGSGVPDPIYQAIEGNRAGSARVALFSNPTKNSGEFYDAFNSKARFYFTLTVSSEESPNVVAGRTVIPGLADPAWIEEKKEEWGVRSALYRVRVLGEFAEHEEGKIFSVHAIEQAEQRWADTPAEGRLYIGVDPAGEKGSGDEITFIPRRGLRMLELDVTRGLDEGGHLVRLLSHVNRLKHPRETPVVVVDREGSVGAKVYSAFKAYEHDNPGVIEVVGVRSSDKSLRQPEIYDRMRDALAASLAAWFDAGGAIVADTKLAKELHTLEWRQMTNGRLKVTPKEALRKLLGRSPDRYDGLALAVWEPLALREDTGGGNTAPASGGGGLPAAYSRDTIDPYDAAKKWMRR